jgi:hypothetical protein
LSLGLVPDDEPGRALVRVRWDHAVDRGTPLLVVQAAPMSAPVLDGLGFVRHGEIRL